MFYSSWWFHSSFNVLKFILVEEFGGLPSPDCPLYACWLYIQFSNCTLSYQINSVSIICLQLRSSLHNSRWNPLERNFHYKTIFKINGKTIFCSHLIFKQLCLQHFEVPVLSSRFQPYLKETILGGKRRHCLIFLFIYLFNRFYLLWVCDRPFSEMWIITTATATNIW